MFLNIRYMVDMYMEYVEYVNVFYSIKYLCGFGKIR